MPAKSINALAFAVLVFMSGAGFFGRTPVARADYYRYTDSKGVICISNDLNAIPPKYRSTMKVIREEKPVRLDKGSPKQASQGESSVVREPAAGNDRQAAAVSQPGSRLAQFLGRYPLIKLLIIIAGIIAASVMIVKLTSLIPSPQLARLISIVFFLGLFVFTYKLYADNLVGNYFTIKTKIVGIFTRANIREAPETAARLPEAGGENTVK